MVESEEAQDHNQQTPRVHGGQKTPCTRGIQGVTQYPVRTGVKRPRAHGVSKTFLVQLSGYHGRHTTEANNHLKEITNGYSEKLNFK